MLIKSYSVFILMNSNKYKTVLGHGIITNGVCLWITFDNFSPALNFIAVFLVPGFPVGVRLLRPGSVLRHQHSCCLCHLRKNLVFNIPIPENYFIKMNIRIFVKQVGNIGMRSSSKTCLSYEAKVLRLSPVARCEPIHSSQICGELPRTARPLQGSATI